MSDSLSAIQNDARRIWCYNTSRRPQDRAHGYLAERNIGRDYCDPNGTAMQEAALDLIHRAYTLGWSEGAARAEANATTADRLATTVADRVLTRMADAIAAAAGENE
jgi:hypothetical protein